MWCSNVYKMASYTVVLLKKFAARPGGKCFSLQRGGGEKFRLAKQMKFRNFAQVPDLILESLDDVGKKNERHGHFI